MQERFRSSEYEQQLSRLAGEIDSIAGEVMEIKDSFRIEDLEFGYVSSSSAAAATASSSIRLAPISKKDVMVGFDDDLLAIKTRLCGGSQQRQVIPVVGMAGIGKTTLAIGAYHDQLIIEHFDIRAWVTVSQDYSSEGVLLGLLASMKDFIKESYRKNDYDDVYKCLKGRRYIVIMDDVWNTQVCDDVRNVFPDDNNGSRIMLTARLSGVAAYPDSSASAHEMLFMNEGQSWNLLRQRVFADKDCPPELRHIGKRIASKCKGLPLAIVAVAGLLSVVIKSPTAWYEIEEKVSSIVAANNRRIEEILSLSYTHLPHYLRPCFLYLGSFREDTQIRVSQLIRLWVAEGFLKCENEGKSLEEAAEDYLDDLVRRNLVLVSERRSNGKIKSCKLHDLIRDLCIRKAKEEEFLVDLTTPEEVQKQYDAKLSVKHHRRVAINVRLTKELDSGEHFHLRYLAANSLTWCHTFISNFENLQTLIIQDAGGGRTISTFHDEYLPHEIWRLPQLQHRLFCGRMYDPEEATSPLEKLQTLKNTISVHKKH